MSDESEDNYQLNFLKLLVEVDYSESHLLVFERLIWSL